MVSAQGPECPNCRRLKARVAEMEALVLKLQAHIEALEAENACLRKNSSTSHKPPSRDIVKPPRSKAGRRKEAQDRRLAGP